MMERNQLDIFLARRKDRYTIIMSLSVVDKGKDT